MPPPSGRRSYKNPPIEEAVVEFRFAHASEWDPTIPGKLHQHESIKDRYPGKPRQQKFVQATLQTIPGQPMGLAVQEGDGRVQLVDTDAKRLVSLGPDVLSINVLRPYEGWHQFRPRIDDALEAYAEVAGVSEVSRIGVRYINKIVIPSSNLELSTYFSSLPLSPPGLPEQMGAFLNRVEYVYHDGCKLLLTQASVDGLQGTSAFLVDLDVVWEAKDLRALATVMPLVDDLHERVSVAFEAIITDDTRGVLNAV